MPKYRYVAVDADGARGQGRGRSAERVRARDATCCASNLEVQQVKQDARALARSSSRTQKVPRSEIMHFSRQMAAFVRSGIPIIDGLEVIAEGTNNKRFRQIMLSRSTKSSARACRSPTRSPAQRDLPAVLPRHPALGRADRPPRRRCSTSSPSYIERDARSQEQDQVGADVSARRARDVDRHDRDPRRSTCCRSSPTSSRTSTPSCRSSTRMLLGRRELLRRTSGTCSRSLVLGRRRHRHVAAEDARTGNRLRDRILLRMPVVGDVVLYSVVERFCRILGAMSHAGVPLPEAMPAAIDGVEQHRLRGAAAAARRKRCSRARAWPSRSRDTGLFPRRGGADDPRRRGDRHARPAARERGRLLLDASSTTSSSGSRRSSSPAVIIFMGVHRRLRRRRARAGDVRHLQLPGDQPHSDGRSTPCSAPR